MSFLIGWSCKQLYHDYDININFGLLKHETKNSNGMNSQSNKNMYNENLNYPPLA